tara:strand:+ start:966 stop:1805 length:840 start_codon:yes stop_codon:yes gene_type:complete
MPVSSTIFSTVAAGDSISAKEIRDRFSELERFLNGGIQDIDFNSTDKNIFSNQHIIKPEFYSVANTRVEGVTSDVFYRNTNFSSYNRHVRHETSGSYNTDGGSFDSTDLDALPADAWQPIDGMAATVNVKGNSNVLAFVNGSLYGSAVGSDDRFTIPLERIAANGVGTVDADLSEVQRAGFNRCVDSGIIIAAFKLYVDKMDGLGPQPVNSTKRRLFNRGENSYRFRHQQISFATRVLLSPGPNKISYRCIYRLKEHNSRALKHVFIDSRNFFVDVHYK